MDRPRRMVIAVVALALVLTSAQSNSALAAGRCSATAGGVEERIAAFWQCVGLLGPSDYLPAEDLGQWARNVTQRSPTAGIRTGDFRASTSVMQTAFDRASVGVPPAPPNSADVETRIALFWQRVNGLGACDLMTATDLGQWALNVIDRDPSRRLSVGDFRASSAAMQSALDTANGPCPRPLPLTRGIAGCPMSTSALPVGATLLLRCNGQAVVTVDASGQVGKFVDATAGSGILDISPDLNSVVELTTTTDCTPACETHQIPYVRSLTNGTRMILGGLPDPPSVTMGRFSPDSRAFAFTSSTRQAGTGFLCCPGLWIADVAAGTSRRVDLSPRTTAASPVWSPSGTSLAFICDSFDVCTAGSDGRAVRSVFAWRQAGGVLLDLPQFVTWLSDQRLAIVVGSSPVDMSQLALVVVDIGTGQRTRFAIAIDQPLVQVECLSGSPDGRFVLYERFAGASAFSGSRSSRLLDLATGGDTEFIATRDVIGPNNGSCPVRWLK